MTAMRVKLDDQSWSFDEDTLDLRDAFLIKSGTGLNFRPFLEGVQEMDPLCLQGLVWFLRRKAGEDALTLDEVNFRLAELDVTQEEAPPLKAVATSSESVATA